MHDEPTAEQPTAFTPSSPPRALYHPGDTIGRYTIRQTLGEGGFGVVYQAEQTAPIKRMVALKVIKPGMDSKAVVARFEAERQALALMDHPGVAKVFDGGVTETGRPYFAMELVKGVPITDYCDTHKLSLDDRIQLFQKVCNAVQHAHAKGLIHRDLKPSNILVVETDEGHQPKVIDFGISKALDQKLTEDTLVTEQGAIVGTPAYMSPEQADGATFDIDTRSDIYALGVIFYELLTGSRPFEPADLRRAGIAEMLRVIREDEPARPSSRLISLAGTKDSAETASRILTARSAELRTLTGVLKRDLDWVVMKCLEKDRARRYDTASELAAELDRYLKSQPVLAGPPSASYQISKFINRNKTSVVAATVVAGALATGFVGTVLGLLEARHQQRVAVEAAARETEQRVIAAEEAELARRSRDQAEIAEAAAEARASELQLVLDFQATQLDTLNPPAMGDKMKELIVEASPDEDREATLAAVKPINFTGIARRTLEATLFDVWLDSIDEQYQDEPVFKAKLLHAVGATMLSVGSYTAAEDPTRRALALRIEHLGKDHPDTTKTTRNLGALSIINGKASQAELLLRRAYEAFRDSEGPAAPVTLSTASMLAFSLDTQGKVSEAVVLWKELLDSQRKELGNDDWNTLNTIMSLGESLAYLGETEEAESLLREAVATSKKTLDDDDPMIQATLSNLANFLSHQDRHDEALPLALLSLERKQRYDGDEAKTTLDTMKLITIIYVHLEDFDEAQRIALDYERTARTVYGGHHGLTKDATDLLADLYTAWHEAEPTAGHDLKAAEWQAKLPPKQDTTPPPDPEADPKADAEADPAP